jgi:flagellar biosynthetic protein FliP
VKTDGSNAVQLLLLIGGISLVPALLFTVTGFTRILIVLGFIRSGLGTPTAPPNQVLVGIALFLTLFVMAPTFKQVKDDAITPLTKGKITQQVAFKRAEGPMREFMFDQTRTKDLALFAKLGKLPQPKTRADIPTFVLIPSFIISELKTAFQIGFLIFLPFLIIDLVVGATLMSMGMVMLPPVFISLPFKILLFVLVDGWNLVTRSLVESFHI